MKSHKLLLLLFLSLCSVSGFTQEKFYREKGKTLLLTQEEYQLLKNVKKQKFLKPGQNISFVEHITDSVRKGGNIIYTYQLELVFAQGMKLSLSSDSDRVYELYGKSFPNFKLPDANGNMVRLSDLKGKPLVINFWFTGCKPCIREMPRLNEIKERFGEKVKFLSVTYNSREELQVFLQKHRFDFEHLTDARELVDKIGIRGFPKTILLDRKGKVAQILEGIYPKLDEQNKVVEGDGQELIREIEKIL